MSDTKDAIDRMVRGLVKGHGYCYATGYLESFLAGVIDDHVKDPIALEKLRMRMVFIGIDKLLDAPKYAPK